MPQSVAPAILHVDLATAGMRRVAASPRLSRGEGGRALSTALCDMDRRVAWDDADAPLCLAAGALAGCDLPGCGHVSLTFFSPRTGGVATACLGGGLGHALARAGIAAVVVTGRATRPVGLAVANGDARLVPAGDLAGLATPARFDALDPCDAALVTGPAAQAGARLATAVVDRWHDAGPTGAGLALAAKNLVYVAVSGTGRVAAADPEGLDRARAAMERLIAASPALAGPCGFAHHGTAALVDLTHGRRMQPTDDFRATYFPQTAPVNAPALGKRFAARGVACPGCPVPCRRLDASGRLLPDVDALSHFTALLELTDADLAVSARQYCLEQGLDPAGAAASLAAWATARGKTPDAGFVREGLAALAAGGAPGGEIEAALALAVKGVPLPAFDPRGAYGLALSLAVGTGGPDPWRGGCLAHELLRKPVATDRFTFEGKARAVVLGENALAAAQSLGGCAFLSLAVTLEEWALALSAASGAPVAAGDLAALGARVVCRERAQNLRQGPGPEADDLPVWFFSAPGTAGEGIVVPPLPRAAFLAARDKYRRLRGDGESAAPREASWTP